MFELILILTGNLNKLNCSIYRAAYASTPVHSAANTDSPVTRYMNLDELFVVHTAFTDGDGVAWKYGKPHLGPQLGYVQNSNLKCG